MAQHVRNWRANDGGGSEVAGEIRGLVQISLAARRRRACSQTERELVFGEDVGKTFHLAGIGRGEDHALARRT